ncbi:MAG: cobalt ECF transporter T component CbiQ [Oscillospiraceae bacterium]
MLIDKYPYISPLANCDTAAKLLLSLGTLVICLVTNNIIFSAVIFILMSLFTVAKGKIPIKYYLKLCIIPISFILIGTLTIIINFNTHATGLVSVKVFGCYAYISWENLYKGITIAVNSMATVSCVYFLCLTTSLESIMISMYSAHIPVFFIHLLGLTYRFIFSMLNTFDALMMAQRARLGNYGIKAQFRSFTNMASSLFIQMFMRVTQINEAMDSRLYNMDLMYLQDRSVKNAKQITYTALIIILQIVICVCIKII